MTFIVCVMVFVTLIAIAINANTEDGASPT